MRTNEQNSVVKAFEVNLLLRLREFILALVRVIMKYISFSYYNILCTNYGLPLPLGGGEVDHF